jgi:hypothetical protein
MVGGLDAADSLPRKVGVCTAEVGEASDMSLETNAEGGLQQIMSSQVAAF